jgi:hypothetical protein
MGHIVSAVEDRCTMRDFGPPGPNPVENGNVLE